MLAFYGSRISEHMTETPEGFLVCHHVPIARTGFQAYLPEEINADGEKPVRVFRPEEEVFSAAAMASFEGKPVTCDHPPEAVTAQNSSAYACGHIQNVRRGKGEESGLLIADLFITDAALIRRIQHGLREVSCGYDCVYAQDGDGMRQTCIRGNHVAVVEAGRAGERVAIRDARTKTPVDGQKERKFQMLKKPSLLGKLFGIATRDADPESVAEIASVLAAAECENEKPGAVAVVPDAAPAAPPAGKTEKQEDETPALLKLTEAVDALCKKIDTLAAAPAAGKPADPLDALEAELAETEEDEDPEESVTVPAESMDGETSEEEMEDEMRAPEEKKPSATGKQASLRAVIGAIKPIIAALPQEQRMKASDAAAKALRGAITSAPVYSQLAQARAKAARSRNTDAAAQDDSEIGRRIMAARNPHYKKA